MGETPCPAAARHGRTELGCARRKPPIGAARKPEGRAVSLLCLAKAASAHAPRSSTAADLNNPVFQEQRAAGVSQSRSIVPTTRTQSALATTATGRTGPCAAANQAWRVSRGESAAPAAAAGPRPSALAGRLSPAAARGSGRGHLGRCGNTCRRC